MASPDQNLCVLAMTAIAEICRTLQIPAPIRLDLDGETATLQARMFDDVEMWMVGDILDLAAVLIERKGRLRIKQYDFLRAMHTYVIGDRWTIDHRQWLKYVRWKACSDYPAEPGAYSLNRLRGFDAARRTSSARKYREFLWALLKATLSLSGVESKSDALILAEFTQYWSELEQCSRATDSLKFVESESVINAINEAVKALVLPIHETASTMEYWRNGDYSATESWIRGSFETYFSRPLQLARQLDEGSLGRFEDLAPTLWLFGRNGDREFLKSSVAKRSLEVSANSLPLVVQLADSYDTLHGTDLGEIARRVFRVLIRSNSLGSDNVESECWIRSLEKTMCN